MDSGTLLASVASSLISRIICYPLDTIAIQHTSSTRRPIFSVPLRNYYRGLPVSVCMVTPAFSIYLCTYRQTKESLYPYLGDKTALYATSGIAAELTSSFLWTPFEVLKARLQISRTVKDGQLFSNIREIWTNEGLTGFYRGYWIGLGIFIPYNAVWWGVYENMKKWDGVERLPVAVRPAVCSIAAVCMSAGLLHPLELVKTRYQVATSESVAALGVMRDEIRGRDREGIRQVVRNVVREGNGSLRQFYKGFGPRLCCSIPSSLIMMSVFEHFKPELARDK
ncbi:hypothetical protein NHQ30_006458 [Ciborinia camelliae]|nr:hypothetical protein NHQ30_006458 [Ciborinia camelliae]